MNVELGPATGLLVAIREEMEVAFEPKPPEGAGAF
jgi:hypothetical protein